MLNPYLANSSAYYYPIPSDPPVITTQDDSPYLFKRFYYPLKTNFLQKFNDLYMYSVIFIAPTVKTAV